MIFKILFSNNKSHFVMSSWLSNPLFWCKAILLYNSLSPSRSSGFRRLNAARSEMGWPVVSDGRFEGRRQREPGEVGGLSVPPPPKTPTGPGWLPGLCDGARLLNNARGPGSIFTPQADFGRMGPRLTPTWHCSESKKAIFFLNSLLKTKTKYKNLII
jgi:hypothetical protein